MEKPQKVVVLGASSKPERKSNQAVAMLQEAGHSVVPVHPAIEEIHGIPVKKKLREVEGPVDTLTLYVGRELSQKMESAITDLNPGRLIFNPGAENPDLMAAAEKAGIPTMEACTVVLLAIGRF